MIIKRPSVFIYTNNPDTEILSEICAGMEEEGVFYEIESRPVNCVISLAHLASNDSMLGCGIGVYNSYAALSVKGLPKDRFVNFLEHPDNQKSRNLGSNAARIVKKQPLKE